MNVPKPSACCRGCLAGFYLLLVKQIHKLQKASNIITTTSNNVNKLRKIKKLRSNLLVIGSYLLDPHKHTPSPLALNLTPHPSWLILTHSSQTTPDSEVRVPPLRNVGRKCQGRKSVPVQSCPPRGALVQGWESESKLWASSLWNDCGGSTNAMRGIEFPKCKASAPFYEQRTK